MNSIFLLTQNEYNRQRETISLIASENLPSPKVIDLLGGSNSAGFRSLWSNKYGEGYPYKRYYAGNQFTDELESLVQNKALEVFGKIAQEEYSVNVQMNAGSMANMMVYLSILNPEDTVVSLEVANGGHISHMHKTSAWTKFFKFANYDLKEIEPNSFEIDFEDYCQKILDYKPKLVIIGCSSYPKKIDKYPEMIKFAHENGSLVLCDVAHINGLIATGLHDSPFGSNEEGADFVTMTTHKTFRGPRGALLFCKKEFSKIINQTVFPGTSGGPHFNKIAGIGQACLEILGEDMYPDGRSFLEYSHDLVEQTKLLEQELYNQGLQIISPTQTHLCLVKLPDEVDSLETQQKLDSIGIVCNRNGLPFEKKTMWRPSGLRLGTATLTSRGASDEQVKEVAQIISDVIFGRDSVESIQRKVKEITQNLNWWY
jgi:glycine hydroxymethyltransferase